VTPEPSPPIAAGACPLCGTAAAMGDERCAACGFSLAGVDGRPAPFSRATLWWSVAGFAAVYVATLVIVALTR
jgi:hypothetical protein